MIPSTQKDLEVLINELKKLTKSAKRGKLVRLRIFETFKEKEAFDCAARVIRLGIEKTKKEGKGPSIGFKQIVGYEYDEKNRKIWYVEMVKTVGKK